MWVTGIENWIMVTHIIQGWKGLEPEKWQTLWYITPIFNFWERVSFCSKAYIKLSVCSDAWVFMSNFLPHISQIHKYVDSKRISTVG